MTYAMWLLVLPLWFYFYFMAVEPEGDAFAATRAQLPRKLLFPGDVARTIACVLPIAILNERPYLDINPFVASIALTTLAEPLLALAKPIPHICSVSLFTYGTKWLVGETDKFVKTAIWMLPFWLAGKFDWFSPVRQAAWLSDHFSLIDRLPNSLSLPIGFYALLSVVLLIRVLMLLAVPKRPTASAIIGLLAGCFAISYFYNLTGKVHLTEENWEAQVVGFIAALCLKFVVSWHWVRLDAEHEGNT